jgi:WhiB family redox-sensing transcriptional regulator
MLIVISDSLRNASCKNVSELEKQSFFSESGNGYKRAVKICSTCPVQAECLDDALAFELPGEKRYGVRGGLSAKERKRLVEGELQTA